MPVQKYDINTELLEEFDLESFIKQYKNVSANNFILNTKINSIPSSPEHSFRTTLFLFQIPFLGLVCKYAPT